MSGDWDSSYHYFYDGHSMIETRNGSDIPIKHHVWGLQYIDELCQILINADPGDPAEADLEYMRFGLQDANYNLLAIVNEDGYMKDRFEYTPYGQRTAYTTAGADDPLCLSPILDPRQRGGQAYSFCDIGHQGLQFDKEFGLWFERTRYLQSVFGRHTGPDLYKYINGMNMHEYVGSNPIDYVDPWGLEKLSITVAADATIAAIHILGEDIVGAYDLSSLLTQIKEKVGKYDTKGEDPCNCIRRLKLIGHGVEKERDIARGVQPVSPQADKDPMGPVPNAQNDPGGFAEYKKKWIVRQQDPLANKEWLGSEGPEGDMNAASTIFFQEISKLKCEGGIYVIFHSCYSGNEERGLKMLRNVAKITEGPVTGYTTKVKPVGIAPIAKTRTVTKNTIAPSELKQHLDIQTPAPDGSLRI